MMLFMATIAMRPAPAFGQREPVADIYRKLKQYAPDENVAMGIDYLNKSVLDSALVCFSIARASLEGKVGNYDRQNYLTALEGMGIVYFCYGNYAQAFSMFRLVVDTDPDFIDAYQNLASIYQLFGEYDRARTTLAVAYDKNIEQGNMKKAAVAVMNTVYINFLDGTVFEHDSIADDFMKHRLLKEAGEEEIRARKICQAAALARSGRYGESAELLQGIVDGMERMS